MSEEKDSTDRLQTLASELDCITQDDLRLLTKTTAATLEGWRKRGAGPSYILAGNNYLYPRKGVVAWLQSQVRERRQSVGARGCL